MMMLISAADLIALYLGLELMSLALYVVAAINRDNVRSTEAGLKYFVLGALSSGMLLYGASLIYGFTGTVSFAGIAKAAGHGSIGLIFGLVFLFAASASRCRRCRSTCGRRTSTRARRRRSPRSSPPRPRSPASPCSCAPPSWRFPASRRNGSRSWCSSSIASMALGAFAAIGQRNIKRLMAYSSIGHMGFALVGLAAGTPEGVQGVLVYMAIYVAMTLGTFACILAMRRDGMHGRGDQRSRRARPHQPGAWRSSSPMLLFSLAGIPPLAGFFAKFYVFLAAIKAGLLRARRASACWPAWSAPITI